MIDLVKTVYVSKKASLTLKYKASCRDTCFVVEEKRREMCTVLSELPSKSNPLSDQIKSLRPPSTLPYS